MSTTTIKIKDISKSDTDIITKFLLDKGIDFTLTRTEKLPSGYMMARDWLTENKPEIQKIFTYPKNYNISYLEHLVNLLKTQPYCFKTNGYYYVDSSKADVNEFIKVCLVELKGRQWMSIKDYEL